MRAGDGAVLILVLVIGWSLYRSHRANNDFNLLDLLMENGRVSKLSCIAVGAFAVMSWIMVRLAIDGKMTEGFLGLYGGLCFTPICAKLFASVVAPAS